jgi:RNA polymerase sigma-70 factor (ECF subfamily)
MNPVNHRSSINGAMKEAAARRDARLVGAAQAGSSAAFAELQRLYSGPLYRTILKITRNKEDAEDALQDSFMRAFLSLCRFEGRSSFYSWLTRIGINSALIILRRRRSRAEVSFELYSDAPGESAEFEVRESSLDPEQICDQHQRRSQLFRAIQKLEPGLRAVVQLQITGDRSLEEIAGILKITEAAVKARLYRARQRLRMKSYRTSAAPSVRKSLSR